MKKMSEKIFYHEVGCHEEMPNDAEYHRCKTAYQRTFKKLCAMLNEEEKKLVDDLYDEFGEVMEVLARLYFQEGLKAGLRLGMEVFEDCNVWEE